MMMAPKSSILFLYSVDRFYYYFVEKRTVCIFCVEEIIGHRRKHRLCVILKVSSYRVLYQHIEIFRESVWKPIQKAYRHLQRDLTEIWRQETVTILRRNALIRIINCSIGNIICTKSSSLSKNQSFAFDHFSLAHSPGRLRGPPAWNTLTVLPYLLSIYYAIQSRQTIHAYATNQIDNHSQ